MTARNWYLCAASAFSLVMGFAARAGHAGRAGGQRYGRLFMTSILDKHHMSFAPGSVNDNMSISSGVAGDPRVFRVDLAKHFLGTMLADFPSASSTPSMRVTI